MRRALAGGAAVVLISVVTVGVHTASAQDSGRDAGSEATPLDVPAQVEAQAATHGEAEVIVQLTDDRGRSPGATGTTDSPTEVSERGNALLDAVDDDGSAKVLDHLGAVSLTATPAQLEELSRSILVRSIEPNLLLAPADTTSVQQIGAPVAWGAGFDGQNEQVAVIDSGIDGNHPALAGKVVYEACFTNGSCPNGASTQTGAGAARPCDVGLACQHGTHVAGIVAGGDQSFPGVAPGAQLLALQVFSVSNSAAECGSAGAPCPRARTSDVLAALNHLVDVRASFPQLVAVNMSLSSDAAVANCNTSVLAGAVTKLKALGVATVVASGNSGATTGLGVPACITDTVSVGATYADQDAVWPLSNVSPDLDLLAPGVAIQSPAPGGGYSPTTGTSAAAPHVAGAWAIVAQRLGTNDVETIRSFLVNAGKPISYGLPDGSTLVKPLLNLRTVADGTAPAAANAAFASVPTDQSGTAGFTPVSGDFDGDGRSDIFWYGNGGASWVWLAIGGGRFGGYAAPAANAGYTPIVGDFDGNGMADIFWYGNGIGNWLWSSTGGAQFRATPTTMASKGYVPVTGDFDGDRRTDIFWYGPGGLLCYLWRSLGNGSFVGANTWAVGGNFTVATGDFDGDGRDDIVWSNPDGTDYLWRNVGGLQFSGLVAPDVSGALTPVPGDLDGDGRDDLLWYAPGNSTKWTATGGMQFSTQPVATDSTRLVPVGGDFDGDHRSDVFWYSAGGTDQLWLSQ